MAVVVWLLLLPVLLLWGLLRMLHSRGDSAFSRRGERSNPRGAWRISFPLPVTQ